MKFRNLSSLLSVLSLALLVPACGDDDSSSGTTETGDEDAGGSSETSEAESSEGETSETTKADAGETSGESTSSSGDESTGVIDDTDGGAGDGGGSVTGDGGADGGDTTEPPPPPPECPPVGERELVDVGAVIDSDEVWSCDKVYQLPNQPTVVADGATLTVEPGVEVWGQQGSALVITRGSKIDANGQANAPIVFTSGALPGERAPGNWGGVLLLGGAPVNDGESNAEGIDPTNGYSSFGGDDEEYDCGSMSYVRIEFGGFELSPDNELNNLGVAGCGSQTELHHIQLHMGSDDGIEFWGGSPVVHHIVSSRNSDDSFDWTGGFSSDVQFLAIVQNPADADACFEADNNEDNFSATPVSSPTFYNVTAVGGPGQEGDSPGAVLRRGTAGRFYNSIFMGFGLVGVDVRDAESAALTEGDSPDLTIENSLFFNNGPDGETHFPVEAEGTDNDNGLDEVAYFTDEAKNNVLDVDPELADAANLSAPNFVPADDSVVGEGAKTPGTGFDAAAKYMGAFEPGGADWTEGWTAYPEN